MILPWLTFALLFAAIYARMIRASVLETLDEDYVRTARAKGASELAVVQRPRAAQRDAARRDDARRWTSAVRASEAALFIETVYGLPGLGKVLRARRSLGSDLPVIMGVVLVVSFAVAIANLIVRPPLLLDRPAGARRDVPDGRSRRRIPRRRASSARARFEESTT